MAYADGSVPQLCMTLACAKLMVLDDGGLTPISQHGRQDLLEVIEDRVLGGSVLITSQTRISKWDDYLGEPTIAGAMLGSRMPPTRFSSRATP